MSWIDELQVTDSGAGPRPTNLGWVDELGRRAGSTSWDDELQVTDSGAWAGSTSWVDEIQVTD